MPKSDLPIGGEYAPVADRVALFYERFPSGLIMTDLITRDHRTSCFAPACTGPSARACRRFDSLFLRAVTDAKGQRYAFAYNALGWVVSDTGAAGPVAIAFAYDRNGNVTSVTNRRGQLVSMAYDSLDNLRERIAGADTARYFTDPLGLLTAASNAASSDTARFDKAGRLTSQIMVRDGTRIS